MVVGLTWTLPESATPPMPWSTVTDVVFFVDHESVDVWPAEIDEGVAPKLAITGSGPGVGVGEGEGLVDGVTDGASIGWLADGESVGSGVVASRFAHQFHASAMTSRAATTPRMTAPQRRWSGSGVNGARDDGAACGRGVPGPVATTGGRGAVDPAVGRTAVAALAPAITSVAARTGWGPCWGWPAPPG